MEKQLSAPSSLLAKQFTGPTNVFAQVKSNNDVPKNRTGGNYSSTLMKPLPQNLNLECN
jgi:hypothetical protein